MLSLLYTTVRLLWRRPGNWENQRRPPMARGALFESGTSAAGVAQVHGESEQVWQDYTALQQFPAAKELMHRYNKSRRVK